jgi:iron(III) transport system permease protein
MRLGWLGITAILCALLMTLPILTIVSYVWHGNGELWRHLLNTVLSEYIVNSLLLMLGVAVGVLLLGVPTAWLTSMCEFPGRNLLSWALLLPMAVPAYIIAYTYTGLLDFAGPVQTGLRDITGLSYGQYWFFEIRSLGGAIVMLSLVLYPYVYLLSRASFLEQSSNILEVGRTLGYSPWKGLLHLSLPLARPAIVAGLTLALMETLADYGTVEYFGINTFTTGIFRTFYGFGNVAAAAQLATVLLGFVVLLILLERYSRRQIRYYSMVEYRAGEKRIVLGGLARVLALVWCLTPLLLGFALPALQLTYWALFEAQDLDIVFVQLMWNSFSLAMMAAILVTLLALLLAYSHRLCPQPARAAVTLAGMGYALPGTIIAIGVIIPLAWLDHQLIDWAEHWLGLELSLIFSGSLVALLFAYSVRFLAVALGSVKPSLSKIKPSLDHVGHSLGYNRLAVLRHIHLPLMRSSILTAALIVFVDVLKELPATLILRPFDFNTMAVRAYELAADERLIDAAPPSLMIVLVGLAPVILLSRSIARGIPQHNPTV